MTENTMTMNNPGVMQYPMDRDAQKAAGLIAKTSRSIKGREVKTGGGR